MVNGTIKNITKGMDKIIATTYNQVTGYIKLAKKAKQKIAIKRMGNNFVGVYYEVELTKNPREGIRQK